MTDSEKIKQPLKCLIVDDESMARRLLEENARQLPFLEVVGTAKNPFEAMQFLQSSAVDLMFLDIQMPGMLGTQFLATLREKPMVIFVTAYSNYAVEGFELEVIDYLLKPVSMERFTKAALKALDEKQKRLALEAAAEPKKEPKSEAALEHFFVNSDYALVKITVNDISHIEGLKDYVKIFLTTARKPVLTKSTLKGIEERLPEGRFLRVHKSFIVQIEKVESIRNSTISIGEHQIPVSPSSLDELKKALRLEE